MEEQQNKVDSNFKAHKGKTAVLIIYGFFILSSIFGIFFLQQVTDKVIEIVNSWTPEHIDQFSREYIEYLKNSEVEQAFSFLDQDLQNDQSKENIEYVQQYVEFTTDEIELVGLNVNKVTNADGEKENFYSITYEIQNRDPERPELGQMVFVLNLLEKNNDITVKSFLVQGTEVSAREAPAENIKNNIGAYIVFLLIHMFVLYTAYLYIKQAKEPKWKWLLLILLLTVSINLAGSSVNVNFGFNFDPANIAVPIPVGVVAYYVLRKKLIG